MTSKTIDYMDLSVRIPENVSSALEEALSEFQENQLHIEIDPKFKKGILHVNSNDLIALLGYFESEGLTEIAFFKFKKEIKHSLEQQLLRSLSLDTQSHYKWCISALKTFEFGRFL